VRRFLPLLAAFTAILAGSAQSANKYTVLHYFENKPAAVPITSLVSDSAGNLYGTTLYNDVCGNACGTVFKLTRQTGGGWSYRVIHRFLPPDGQDPDGALILDSSGNLYGTTRRGGANSSGTVFELSPSGNVWKEKILYSFQSSGDVTTPVGALTFDQNGNLYGAAVSGGPQTQGGIFELQPVGKGWQEKVLYAFTGGVDGGQPFVSQLVFDSQGNLYGTAASGGQFGWGVVFELSAFSNGPATETVLYDFTDGTDGALPEGGVIFDASGNLFGTAAAGPPSSCDGGLGCGTVFELTPSMGKWTTGKWTFNLLHDFNGTNGDSPAAGLIFDSSGNLYGTTLGGGTGCNLGCGVVFKLSPSGGSWTESVLHRFDSTHGAVPYGGLIFDSSGTLFGTASGGGQGPPQGYGVVFSIAP
jgi:uncharacterized repeat protein (TIGR03803 family)